MNAIQALYQLSYSPEKIGWFRVVPLVGDRCGRGHYAEGLNGSTLFMKFFAIPGKALCIKAFPGRKTGLVIQIALAGQTFDLIFREILVLVFEEGHIIAFFFEIGILGKIDAQIIG